MRSYHFSRKLRQFKNCIIKISLLQKEGKWIKLDKYNQNALLHKVNVLFKQLLSVFSQASLKYHLGTAFAYIGLFTSSALKAQNINFASPLENPFNIQFDDSIFGYSEFIYPALIDINSDGNPDLFLGGDLITLKDGSGESIILYQPNITSGNNIQFGTIQHNPFNIVIPYLRSQHKTHISFTDIDDDGDQDMFMVVDEDSLYTSHIWFYENIGDSVSPSFDTHVKNPFGITTSEEGNKVTFGDIDGDGDQDIFIGTYYGEYFYYENTGTSQLADFSKAPVNTPFGLNPPAESGSSVFLVDIDMDGDLDLFTDRHSYTSAIFYYENIGTSDSAQFSLPLTNPFGLSGGYLFSAISFADIDGDGDMDLFEGQYATYNYNDSSYSNKIKYFENKSDTSSANPPVVSSVDINGSNILGDTTYFNASVVSGTGTGNLKYAWSGDDGFAASEKTAKWVYSATGTFKYTLKVTDSLGLEGIYTGNVTIKEPNDTTSIAEYTKSSVIVYPVPAKNRIYFEMENDENYIVTLYGLNGNELFSHRQQGKLLSLDLNKVASGLYLYSIAKENDIIKRGKINLVK